MSTSPVSATPPSTPITAPIPVSTFPVPNPPSTPTTPPPADPKVAEDKKLSDQLQTSIMSKSPNVLPDPTKPVPVATPHPAMTLPGGDPITGLYLMAKLLIRNMPSGDTYQLAHWYEAFTKELAKQTDSDKEPVGSILIGTVLTATVPTGTITSTASTNPASTTPLVK